MIVTAANVFVVPVGNRTGVILELETDAGITGIGEAGIAYGMGIEATAEMVLKMLRARVLGRDAGEIELIWSDIYDRGFWTKSVGAITTAALSAIEIALWDIKGKALGVPVHSLFGGTFRNRLEIYANGWWMGCDTPQDFATAAKRMVDKGLRGLKLYPLGLMDPVTVIRHPTRRRVSRDTLNLCINRVEAIRKAVGSEVDILLDMGGGVHADQLRYLMPRLEPLDVGFIEEPIDPAAPENYASLRSPIPVAAGERAYTRYGFQRMLQAGGIEVLQPDVCNTGGLAEARRIAALGEIYNCSVAPHNYGTTLATVVSAHLSATIANFQVLECFPDFREEPGYVPLIDTPLEDQIEGSTVPVPQGPGLGVTLRRQDVEQHLWKRLVFEK
ncbi:mandelate racemase/muconate lactonizing enzyme family protein [Xinfangfangia sp. CPCC 101601]|uniref:Mandelate racemase/muconate lactonizing enzyme family protein n=1 Tax=Pseudogemmobacter lacusdianii TaxID=3069608 RepID=A0ABU0W2Y1_9RHOB|nr:mandelate racemase/muconate lactonizing enzyme family protein [Xinfangfangia sp. CPCC 101601]MDQ2068143.1 mandelate racemase/muconate lactonizing enzyme family protein [Xinfangfangia sp. CPCC 101601]